LKLKSLTVNPAGHQSIPFICLSKSCKFAIDFSVIGTTPAHHLPAAYLKIYSISSLVADAKSERQQPPAAGRFFIFPFLCGSSFSENGPCVSLDRDVEKCSEESKPSGAVEGAPLKTNQATPSLLTRFDVSKSKSLWPGPVANGSGVICCTPFLGLGGGLTSFPLLIQSTT
jgi:hypothetical protein